VYLDVNGLRLTGRRFGVGRYVEYLFRNWTTLEPPFEGIRLFTPREIERPFELAPFVDHRVVSTRRSNGWWEQAVLPRLHRSTDLLFCPSYVVPLTARGKIVVTHLGSYEAMPSAFPLRERVKTRLLYQLSARKADVVITVSQSSREDIVRYYRVAPEKVVVIPLGVDPAFRPLDDPVRAREARVRLLGADRPFVLFVGKLTRRRNIPELVEAFARLKRDRGLPHALVLVGQNTAGHDLAALASSHGIDGDLVAREFEEHDTLVELYNAAELFVYPSSYEGFGIPVLEAMACGTPTVTLRNTAFLEFAAGAYLAENGTIGELYRALNEVLFSEELKARLRAAGLVRSRDFLWDGIARRTMETLVDVARS
jgi:glycosyltransferase involved in cell wall biosynthesis